MPYNHVLDFNAQAEQMMQIIESRLANGNRDAGHQYLGFKLQSLYAQGFADGKAYKHKGAYADLDYTEL